MEESDQSADNSALTAPWAVLTGGIDKYGHYLMTLPATGTDITPPTSSSQLLLLLRHLASMVAPGKGLAVLVDFRSRSRDLIQLLVDGLGLLQTEFRGCVSVVYGIMPKSRDLQKVTKKLLGVKPSKKYPRPALFQCLLVKQVSDLTQYITPDQLTPDFDGTMSYNHGNWLTFMEMMTEFEDSINVTLDRLPEVHDQMTSLLSVRLPRDNEDATLLLRTLRHTYHSLMSELNLEKTIDDCKGIIIKMMSPRHIVEYRGIYQTPYFKDIRTTLEYYEKELIHSRQQLKSIWQKSESLVLAGAKLRKYQTKADKILLWLETEGFDMAREHANIGDCLSKAEIYKTHFETGLYSTGKSVIQMAREVIDKMAPTLSSLAHVEIDTNSREIHQHYQLFSDQLSREINNFEALLQNKHKIYIQMHNFFATSQKLAKWYQRTLLFLPINSLKQRLESTANGPRNTYVTTPEWKSVVNDFLSRHPAPKSFHLMKLKKIVPRLTSEVVQRNARILLQRVDMLCGVLMTKPGMPITHITEVLYWQRHLQEGREDIALRMRSSTLDLSLVHSITATPKLLSKSMDDVRTQDSDLIRQKQKSNKSLQFNLSVPVESLPHISSDQNNRLSFQEKPASFDDLSTRVIDRNQINSTDLHTKERYVSLGYDKKPPPKRTLPPSLSHLDIDYLENNHPQSSASESASTSAIDLRNSKSSSKIASAEPVELLQETLAVIGDSDLDPADKMELMTRLSEQGIHGLDPRFLTADLVMKLGQKSSASDSIPSPIPTVETKDRDESRNKTHWRSSTIKPHLNHPSRIETSPSRTRNAPHEAGVNETKLHHSFTSGSDSRHDSRHDSRGRRDASSLTTAHNRHKTKTTPGDNDINSQNMDGLDVRKIPNKTLADRQEILNLKSRAIKTDYGIDIEQWVKEQHSDERNTSQSPDSMQYYLTRLNNTTQTRLATEADLAREAAHLARIRLETEQVRQDIVEQTLYRADHLLQEEERILDEQNDVVSDLNQVKFTQQSETYLKEPEGGSLSEESGIYTYCSYEIRIPPPVDFAEILPSQTSDSDFVDTIDYDLFKSAKGDSLQRKRDGVSLNQDENRHGFHERDDSTSKHLKRYSDQSQTSLENEIKMLSQGYPETMGDNFTDYSNTSIHSSEVTNSDELRETEDSVYMANRATLHQPLPLTVADFRDDHYF